MELFLSCNVTNIWDSNKQCKHNTVQSSNSVIFLPLIRNVEWKKKQQQQQQAVSHVHAMHQDKMKKMVKRFQLAPKRNNFDKHSS